jgi:hypothetical protein
LFAAAFGLFAQPTSAADQPGRVFELRTYIASPGKFDALHARFRNHTLDLFKKHGIEVVGFWVPADGPEAKDTLMYFVAFPSVEAQKKAWAAFKADPVWIKAKAASEKDGVPLAKKVISKNYTATDYSPIR